MLILRIFGCAERRDVFAPLRESTLPCGAKHLMLMCKVEFNNSEAFREGYRTLGQLRRV
jgi:hypothetical protein